MSSRPVPPAALMLGHVRDGVAAVVHARGCNVVNSESLDRSAALAAAEVAAATEVPVCTETRKSDLVAHTAIDIASAEVLARGHEVSEAGQRLALTEAHLASLPAMPSQLEIGFTAALGFAGAAAIGVAISQLLPESIDLFIKRPYLVETLGRSAGAARAAWEAKQVAALIACSVALVPMLMVLLSRGRISAWQKLWIGGVEILFAAAFGAIRVTQAGITLQTVAYSFFELSLAGIGVLLCFRCADSLRRGFELRAPRLDAEQHRRDALAWRSAATARLESARASLETAVADIRRRERDVFVRPLLKEVARLTALSAFDNAVTGRAHTASGPLLKLLPEIGIGGKS